MKSIIFKFGKYAFLIGLIAFGLSLYFGANEVLGYTAILISLVFVFLGIGYYKETEGNGMLNFKKALLLGLGITAFAALGTATMDGLYVTVIEPDFYETYGKESIAALEAKGDQEALIKAKEQVEFFASLSPVQLGLFSGGFMFGIVMALGLIVSIISGLLLRTK